MFCQNELNWHAQLTIYQPYFYIWATFIMGTACPSRHWVFCTLSLQTFTFNIVGNGTNSLQNTHIGLDYDWYDFLFLSLFCVMHTNICPILMRFTRYHYTLQWSIQSACHFITLPSYQAQQKKGLFPSSVVIWVSFVSLNMLSYVSCARDGPSLRQSQKPAACLQAGSSDVLQTAANPWWLPHLPLKQACVLWDSTHLCRKPQRERVFF